MAKKKPQPKRSIADHIGDGVDSGKGRGGGRAFPARFTAEAQAWFEQSRQEYHAKLKHLFVSDTAFIRFFLSAAAAEFPEQEALIPNREVVRRWLNVGQ